MARHRVHPSHVCSDEHHSPAHSPDTAIRTLGCHLLFHVDRACEELPADDYQRSGYDPVRHRVIASFWLTEWA